VTFRILLDEHVWNGLVEIGQQLNIDVLPVQKVLPKGANDEEVLSFAAEERRILFTSNARDFEPLAVEWFLAGRNHAGIVIVPGRTNRTVLSQALRALNDRLSPESFENTYRFIQELLD